MGTKMLDGLSLPLLLSALLSWSVAGLLTSVGLAVASRSPAPEARFATAMFAAGWYGLAASALVAGTSDLVGAFGIDALAWHMTLKLVWYGLITASLWAIAVYFVYLFTGEHLYTVPLAGYYGAVFALILFLVHGADPVAVDLSGWQANPVFDNVGFAGAWAPRLAAVALMMPLVGGALGYTAMLSVIESREQRLRIVLVSSTLAAWFGITALVHALDLQTTDAWGLGSRIVQLSAATVLLFAYRLPSRFRDHAVPQAAGADIR